MVTFKQTDRQITALLETDSDLLLLIFIHNDILFFREKIKKMLQVNF